MEWEVWSGDGRDEGMRVGGGVGGGGRGAFSFVVLTP